MSPCRRPRLQPFSDRTNPSEDFLKKAGGMILKRGRERAREREKRREEKRREDDTMSDALSGHRGVAWLKEEMKDGVGCSAAVSFSGFFVRFTLLTSGSAAPRMKQPGVHSMSMSFLPARSQTATPDAAPGGWRMNGRGGGGRGWGQLIQHAAFERSQTKSCLRSKDKVN